MSELATMTIRQLAPLIESRQVSPVEVTTEALARLEALEPRLNAFISVRAEQALGEARAAEAEIGQGRYRGPLHGIPVGIKDNIAMTGAPTTCASRLMADQVTEYDATVVERLREAGAVFVGKNNLHEWAMGSTSAGGGWGTVHNPWDESRVPGGSSGGSAAAVSASVIYGSVGTDGHGSIRIPAAYCGIVGLKPSYGLVSRFGELPPTLSPNDHLGPLTKDVADAAIMLNALAGYDLRDPTSLRSTPKDYTADLGRGVEGLRVGVPENFFFDPATPEVRAAVMRAVGTLASLGAEIVQVRLNWLEHTGVLHAAMITEAQPFLLPFARQGPSAFADEVIWERTVVREFLRATDVMRARRLVGNLRQEYRATMARADLLAVPTAASPAFPIAARDSAEYEAFKRDAALATWLTFPLNMIGGPAVSIPCGFSAEGLPIGLTLAGRQWEDDLVLSAAYAYEQAATGGYAAPPIALEVSAASAAG
jgi:aspartyl-tRNA(Asn)/glutamyl-tRNA(Gln) amidotransferase subunit A